MSRKAFDLILTDVQMPEMDGFEATAKIRAQEQQSVAHVPIVAMTAHAMTGDRARCLSAGMDDYISKPINAQELREIIEKRSRRKPKSVPQPSLEIDSRNPFTVSMVLLLTT